MEIRNHFLLCCLALLLVSCSKKEPKETDLVTFPLRGEVLGIDTVKRIVTVAHEAIPNYMNAMIMPFRVKDPSLLRGVAVGDSIGATLAVSRLESWLETLQVLRKGEAVEALSAEAVQFRHLFREGEEVPDIAFINQEGTIIRLRDLRGKAVALTFIYTRCPLPDFCIRMSENFRQLQKVLDATPALTGKWHLISVSFDAKFDRPPVLKQYGSNYGADFRTWDFVTDPDTSGRTLERFADGFGLTYVGQEGLIAHNLRTVLIDPQGKLVKTINGNAWTPEEVEREIESMLTEARSERKDPEESRPMALSTQPSAKSGKHSGDRCNGER